MHYPPSHFRLWIRPNRPNLAIIYRPNHPKMVMKYTCIIICISYPQSEPRGTAYWNIFLISTVTHPARLRLAHWPRSTGHENITSFSIQSVRLLPPSIIHLTVPADGLSSVRTVPVSISISLPTIHCHDASSVRTLRPSQPSKPSNPSFPTAALHGALPETYRYHNTRLFFYFLILSTISSLFLSLPQDAVRTVRGSTGSLNIMLNPPAHLLKISLHNQSLPVLRSLIPLILRTDGTVWTELSAKPPVYLYQFLFYNQSLMSPHACITFRTDGTVFTESAGRFAVSFFLQSEPYGPMHWCAFHLLPDLTPPHAPLS